ncbi:L-seryl-tRNA(Sec) selenium transferase, partial [Burkholderia multivorans]
GVCLVDLRCVPETSDDALADAIRAAADRLGGTGAAADRGQGGPGITETATQTVTNDRLGEGT